MLSKNPKANVVFLLLLLLTLGGNFFLFCTYTGPLWDKFSELFGRRMVGLVLAVLAYLTLAVIIPLVIAYKGKKSDSDKMSGLPFLLAGFALVQIIIWGMLFWVVPTTMTRNLTLRSDWLLVQTFGPDSAVTKKFGTLMGKGALEIAQELRSDHQVSPGDPQFSLVCELTSGSKRPPFDDPGDLTVSIRPLSVQPGLKCEVQLAGQSKKLVLSDNETELKFQFPRPENGWNKRWRTVTIKARDPSTQATVETEVQFEQLHDELRNITWREFGSLDGAVKATAFSKDGQFHAFLLSGQLRMWNGAGEHLWTVVGLSDNSSNLLETNGKELAYISGNQFTLFNCDDASILSRVALPATADSLYDWNHRWLVCLPEVESPATLCLDREGSLLWSYRGWPVCRHRGETLLLVAPSGSDTRVLNIDLENQPFWAHKFADYKFNINSVNHSKPHDLFVGLKDGEPPQVWELSGDQNVKVAEKPAQPITYNQISDNYWFLQSATQLYCYQLKNWNLKTIDKPIQTKKFWIFGQELLAMEQDSLTVYSLPGLEKLRALNCGSASNPDISPDGRWLAIPDTYDGSVKIYDLSSFTLSKTISYPGASEAKFGGRGLFVRSGVSLRAFLIP